MSKTIYFSKQDKIFTEDGLLLFVYVDIDGNYPPDDSYSINVTIDKVFFNIEDKVSIDITANVLGNSVAKDLLQKEVEEIYDEYIVRGVFDDHNEFNGKIVA